MTDWSLLGGNPVPGNPGGIRATASMLESNSTKVGQQQRLMDSVREGGTSSWQGPAANGFRATVGALGAPISTLIRSHHEAADALKTFASQLESLQTAASQLLAQAKQTHTQITSSQSRISGLSAKASAAQSAYNQAAAAPPPQHPNFIGPIANPGLENAWQNLTSAQGALSSEQEALQAAQSHMSALRTLAGGLNVEGTAAANACAAKLDNAAKPVSVAGKANAVVAFLDSPQFGIVTSLLAIPNTKRSVLEKIEENASEAVEEAEQAEKDGRAAISQAARALSKGETFEARSAAGKVLRNATATEEDLTSAVDEAKGLESGATGVLKAFDSSWTGMVKAPVMGASKFLGYTWGQLAKRGNDDEGAADSATSDSAAAAEDDAGVLGDIGDNVPIVGSVLTATTAGWNISQHHYTSAAGDVAGFGASVAASTVVVALVSNPAGWAVLAAVGTGVLVTEGVDHWRGVVHGLEVAGNGIADGAEWVGGGIAKGAEWVGGGIASGAESVGGGIAHGAEAVWNAL